MRKIWLLRGCAVVITALLAGAWALGLAPVSDEPSSEASRPDAPNSVERTEQFEIQPAMVIEKARARRTRDAEPSPDASAEPSPSATASDTPTADPTTDSPDPTDPPSSADPDPTPTPSPSPSSPPPSNPPSQPSDECTDLGDLIDCVLDPITGAP